MSRFQWKKDGFPPDLSVSPSEGFICPGAELTFDVSYAPVKLRSHIRSDNLSCFIEGLASCFSLHVTSACIASTTRKEVGLQKDLCPLCVVRRFFIVVSHDQSNVVFLFSSESCLSDSGVSPSRWCPSSVQCAALAPRR